MIAPPNAHVSALLEREGKQAIHSFYQIRELNQVLAHLLAQLFIVSEVSISSGSPSSADSQAVVAEGG